MLSNVFLGMSMLGAEWVLYFLVLLSILSISLILERARYYRQATRGIHEFRNRLRESASAGRWQDASQVAQSRLAAQNGSRDLEAEMAAAMLVHAGHNGHKAPVEVLSEVANDAVMRSRLGWERNLSVLATIGSNAPFIGLFGTVLGIIKAFHDLSQQGGAGANVVTAGISEALVATAVGLLVAIPAVVAFNFFQRRVKSALTEAEALKSFLVGKLAE